MQANLLSLLSKFIKLMKRELPELDDALQLDLGVNDGTMRDCVKK